MNLTTPPIAHQEAWTRAKVLHRDVSPGNILIDIQSDVVEDPRAFLNDWDLCKFRDDLTKGPTQHGRSVRDLVEAAYT